LAALGRRTRQVVLLSAVTGVLTGAGVALFDWIVKEQLLDRVLDAPRAVQVGAPVVGLLLAAAALRWLGPNASPSTADEYIKDFHDQGHRLALRPAPSRLLASAATLGLGGAMGFEGPSIYLGAAIGSGLQSRLSRFFSRQDAKVLLVCGAAAGVAAVFKAPATGLVFALEVPYQEDVARRMLLPAGIAAAVSYVTFVSFAGTAPLLAVQGTPPFDIRDLGGAVVLGVVCGVGARLFTQGVTRAKAWSATQPLLRRALVGGVGLGLLAVCSLAAFDRALTIGAGYDNLQWAFDPKRSIALVVLLLALRTTATMLTVAGGGAGGLFIPLVIEGALVGRVMGGLFRTASTGSNFFPLVGVSAFLGAGYRVPLAGVMFAAEATGRPGFIVPGVIASVVAQLFMGRHSASTYQQAQRAGHLERRFALPLRTALVTDTPTVPPDTTVEEFVWQHLLGNRQQVVPVVDGSCYRGIMRIDEALAVDRDAWPATTVGESMRTDFPTIGPERLLRDALVAMEAADVDVLPVVDVETFVGVVTTDEVLRLDEILGRAEGDA
jgi:CIC family chloride channel protein